MADFVFNIAKGRVVELFLRVDGNDPTNSAILVVPVDVGATSDATIKDFDTLAAVLAGGVTERSSNGWNRKTLTDSDLTVSTTPDDSGDVYGVTIPDQTWTPTSGAVTDLLVCYDSDTTGGSDSSVVPLLLLDFAITPDGSLVTADAGTAIFQAS